MTLELKKSSQRASRQPEAASLASTSTPEPAHRSKRSLATMVDEEVVSRSVTPASVGVGVDEKEGDESVSVGYAASTAHATDIFLGTAKAKASTKVTNQICGSH